MASGPTPELFAGVSELGAALAETEHHLAAGFGMLLWTELGRLPSGKRLDEVRKSPRFQTWGVFRAVLRDCREQVKKSPRQAVHAAELAILLAELADSAKVEISDPLRFDWRAEALVALARARQSLGEFEAAQAALDLASSFLDSGTEDYLDRAEWCVQQGALFSDLGEFERAVDALHHAASFYRLAGDDNAVAKVRLHEAMILRNSEPSRALLIAEDALCSLDLEQEHRAELSGRYTMAYCHAELGDWEEAEGILSTYQYLIATFPDFATQASFDWLRGSIAARAGRTAEAEHRLRQVQGSYLERGYRLEAVLCSVDLIEFLTADGRRGEAIYMASQILPILQAWKLNRDTIALINWIKEELERSQVEREVFREVAGRLRRSWYRNGPVREHP
jgi:tetratricopeptide (TPR) repeat protein